VANQSGGEFIWRGSWRITCREGNPNILEAMLFRIDVQAKNHAAFLVSVHPLDTYYGLPSDKEL